MLVGSVKELRRYPVKSFAGEQLLEESRIEKYGMYGDRWHAFVDETKTGWNSYVTARGIPAMLGYRAEVIESPDESEPPHVRVTAPDGTLYRWNEELLEDVQKLTPTKLSMRNYFEQGADLMGVDDSPILLVTDRSLRKLETLWGKSLEPLRFRANLLISLNDDATSETEWVGKELQIGTATIRIDKGCERCSMITLDPGTRERDPSLLKVVHQQFQSTFGMYASVATPGKIAIGDEIWLRD